MNLYVYVSGDPVNLVDPLGLYYIPPTKQQIRRRFNRWKKNNDDISWTEGLIKCPDEIKLCDGDPIDCTNGQWGPLGPASSDFHRGADWCMRSSTVNISSSGQQCCYKKVSEEKGMLIKSGNAAGTPDKYAPFLPAHHFFADVEPYNDALALDGGKPGGNVDDYLERRPPCQGGGSCYK